MIGRLRIACWMLRCGAGFAVCLALASHASAQNPLHVRIDQLIESDNRVPAAPVASDAEFLRRVSLDLIGMPPSAEDLRAFLADASPEKRVVAIDRLLASPQFVRHLTTTLDVMLMERRRNQHIKQEDWYPWLYESVKANKPWNQLAREILAADGVDPAMRPAVRFYLDRESEPNLLTRDTGRIFFGVDMQCAQCHNHPLIDDYLQADYFGLYAFFSGGFAFTAPDKQIYYAERASGEVTFASVFEKDSQDATAPKLLGMPELAEPHFYPGDEYSVAPSDTVRPIPKFSRRSTLAELATNGSHRQFNENIANRLWAHLLGRGLVHPLDLHHPANPPSHPELLKLLGEEFARMNFDMRSFLREIALSQTYQRAYDLPAGLIEQSNAAGATLQELQTQLAALKEQAQQSEAACDAAVAEWNAAREALKPVQKELADARAKSAEIHKKFAAAEKAVADAQAQLTAQQAIAASLTETSAKAAETVQKLPQDAELAQAAQVFVKKLEEIKTQIASLEKNVADKQAALQAPTAELNASRAPIDEILARRQPLADVVLAKQQAVVAARQKMLDDRTAATRIGQRVESLTLFTSLAPQQQSLAASQGAIAQRETELAAAAKAIEDYAPVVTEKQAALQLADAELTKANEALQALKAEETRRAKLIETVAQAETQTRAALEQLKDDADLTAAADKLKQKNELLQTDLTEYRKTVTAGETTATAAAQKREAASSDVSAAQTEMTNRTNVRTTAEQAVAAAHAQAAADQQTLDKTISDLAVRWEGQFGTSPLKPLTAEQLAWSVMQVTGVYERYLNISRAELDKNEPLSDEARNDPAQLTAREWKVEQLTYQKLLGSVGAFVRTYGSGEANPPGEFFATVDQALFAGNAGTVNSWVAPATKNVTERMISEADLNAAANDLYLTLLNRLPTAAESAAVVAYLQSRPEEKSACAQELAWALLNTAEFRFNH